MEATATSRPLSEKNEPAAHNVILQSLPRTLRTSKTHDWAPNIATSKRSIWRPIWHRHRSRTRTLNPPSGGRPTLARCQCPQVGQHSSRLVGSQSGALAMKLVTIALLATLTYASNPVWKTARVVDSKTAKTYVDGAARATSLPKSSWTRGLACYPWLATRQLPWRSNGASVHGTCTTRALFRLQAGSG